MIKQKNISYWVKSLEVINSPLLSLEGALTLNEGTSFDVAIIGGGLTGLWLAYYLSEENPNLKIGIFEKAQVGYGASGRNGGWLSSEVPVELPALKKRSITDEAIAEIYAKMAEAVDEVERVTIAENIDCDLYRGGILTLATNQAQLSRLTAEALGQDEKILDQDEAYERIHTKAIGAHYDPVGARIHPLKLLLGLKRILLKRGIFIYENREVLAFKAGQLTVAGNDENNKIGANKGINITASQIICCTEAYSEPLLKDHKVIPINSSIIVTEIISEERWKKIGWENRELLADNAHLFFYAQRTADDRILIGGRGTPYNYGGKDAGIGTLDQKTQDALFKRLHELFPWESFKIEYAWCGSIGVTRDWCATVSYDESQKIGKIFGFVGSGVTTTNLAARTMCDHLLQRDSDLTQLLWNDHISPKWERDPLRYVAIHGIYALLRYSDHLERKRSLKETAFIAQLTYKICGLT